MNLNQDNVYNALSEMRGSEGANVYSVSTFTNITDKLISDALSKFNGKKKTPVIACVGSDLVLGDSLGPLVGTLLRKKELPYYIYGTLNSTITAKDVLCVKKQISLFHPESFVIAIDAAVGDGEDIGLIKTTNRGLKPGLGVNKNLGTIGDCSIIGIVAERSPKNFDLLNMTRLNLIYSMAEKIAKGIEEYFKEFAEYKNLA